MRLALFVKNCCAHADGHRLMGSVSGNHRWLF